MQTVRVSDKGSVNLFFYFEPNVHNAIQVTMTGVNAGAVKTLVELIYRGIAPLEPEVLLNSLTKKT